MKRRARHYCIAAAATVIVTCGASVGWWLSPGIDFEKWKQGPPPGPWAAYRRQVDRWTTDGFRRSPEHLFTPLEELGEEVAFAVVISEDAAFFDHGAVDLREVFDALRAWRTGGRLRGASTISQQLAKSLFLSPARTLTRKISEVRLAWWLERRLGKRRVLELYLNVVEFGPGVFGVEAAARHYYEERARDLDPLQAAGLAAAVPSPGRDNPATATERWKVRRDSIIRRARRAENVRHQLAKAIVGGADGVLVNLAQPD